MIIQLLLIILAASMMISWIQPANFTPPEQQQTQQEIEPEGETEKPQVDQDENGIETYEPEEEVDETLNQQFEEVLQQIFVLVEQNDYWSMHMTFEDPQKYGLDPAAARVSLGTYFYDQSNVDLNTEILAMIEPYDSDKLSRENYYLKEQLEWDCNLALKLDDKKYEYLDSIWDKSYSLPENMESKFSNYPLYTAEDIPYLIELLSLLPDFMEEAYAYTQEQASQNLLYMNKDYLISYIDTILNDPAEDAVQANLNEQLQSLGLNGADSMTYHKQITDALNQYYYPAMQRCRQIVEEFADQASTPIPYAKKPNGKEYYELLMQYQSGTSKTVGQMRDALSSALNSFLEQMQNLYASQPDFMFGAGDPKVNLGDIQSQLNILKTSYTRDFPEIGQVEIDIDQMSDLDAMNDNVLAYTITSPVGSSKPFIVRYNQNTMQTDSLDFFQTLAHETIPGHIYTFKYRDDYYNQNIQYMLSYTSYMEGWAEYAADKALYWIDMDDAQRQSYLLEKMISNISNLLADIDVNYNGISIEQAGQSYGVDENGYASLVSMATVFYAYDFGELQFIQMEQEAKSAISNFNEVDFNNQMLCYGQLNYDLLEEITQSYIKAVNSSQ